MLMLFIFLALVLWSASSSPLASVSMVKRSSCVPISRWCVKNGPASAAAEELGWMDELMPNTLLLLLLLLCVVVDVLFSHQKSLRLATAPVQEPSL
jgi:hypothetical protein